LQGKRRKPIAVQRPDSRYAKGSGLTCGHFEGILPILERQLARRQRVKGIRQKLEKYLDLVPLRHAAMGLRLRPEALAVSGSPMASTDLTNVSVADTLERIEAPDGVCGAGRGVQLPCSTRARSKIGDLVLREIRIAAEVSCWIVGTSTTSASIARAMTLSGGRGQRIRLATQIGAASTGVLYVLDERKHAGLHQRDKNDRPGSPPCSNFGPGQHLIVVEHDAKEHDPRC